MNFRRRFVHVAGLLSAAFCSGLVAAASAPCVDSATIEKATLGPAAGKHFYLDCAAITD